MEAKYGKTGQPILENLLQDECKFNECSRLWKILNRNNDFELLRGYVGKFGGVKCFQLLFNVLKLYYYKCHCQY